jgi:hypothetical protein
MDKVTITLTWEQTKELESLLWECCTGTDEGIKTLREDLSLTEIWCAVIDAGLTAKSSSDHIGA